MESREMEFRSMEQIKRYYFPKDFEKEKTIEEKVEDMLNKLFQERRND